MKNQECKVRPEIINVNSNEPVFYPFSIKTSKCSGSCNNINDPYAKICVPDVVKDLNIKVFNLMSITNETKNTKWYETCKCECRLNVDANVKNSFIKVYAIKILFGILVIVNLTAIKHVILVST